LGREKSQGRECRFGGPGTVKGEIANHPYSRAHFGEKGNKKAGSKMKI